MNVDTMRERFVAVTGALLDSDPRLAVVLADIGVDRFVTEGAAARHPARLFNVGIREQLLVGFAAGLALEGFRPVLHSYAPFLVERPFEQLKIDFSHQGASGVFVSVGASYDWASGGRTHQAPGDVALVVSLPGWRVHVPGHPDEVETLYRAAAASGENVYLRLADDRNARALPIPEGGLLEVRRGSPGAPTLVAVGPMLDRVMAASSDLDATVLYTATPHPLDATELAARVSGTEVAWIEPYLEGTSAPTVSAALRARPHRLLAVGVPNVEHRRYGSPAEHDRAHGLDARGIRARLDAFLGTGAKHAAPVAVSAGG